ncbi:MAG: response regulator, partial [Bacteroidia bacterium]
RYMKTKINVAVVDDQHLFRQGMVSLLKEFRELNVMMEASNGRELMMQLQHQMPDVILLDLEMPVMDGIETTELLKSKYPALKIIILTMHNEEEMIVHLIEKGVHGFLPKNEDIEIVIDAIYAVRESGYFFNEHVSKAMIKGLMSSKKIKPAFNPVKLIDKEIEVVKLICREFTNKEIADRLSLSSRTIDGYRERILKKIGAKNTVGIVMYAIKHGIIV